MRPGNRCRPLAFVLGLLIASPAIDVGAAPPNKIEDLCVVHRSTVTGNALDVLVFQGVQPLSPGRTVPLRGIYFTPIRISAPFDGTAVMAADGTIRIGILVHRSAIVQYTTNVYASDGMFSGVTDESFAGTLNASFNGDLTPDGVITFVSEPCATLAIP